VLKHNGLERKERRWTPEWTPTWLGCQNPVRMLSGFRQYAPTRNPRTSLRSTVMKRYRPVYRGSRDACRPMLMSLELRSC